MTALITWEGKLAAGDHLNSFSLVTS